MSPILDPKTFGTNLLDLEGRHPKALPHSSVASPSHDGLPYVEPMKWIREPTKLVALLLSCVLMVSRAVQLFSHVTGLVPGRLVMVVWYAVSAKSTDSVARGTRFPGL